MKRQDYGSLGPARRPHTAQRRFRSFARRADGVYHARSLFACWDDEYAGDCRSSFCRGTALLPHVLGVWLGHSIEMKNFRVDSGTEDLRKRAAEAAEASYRIFNDIQGRLQ